MRRRRLERGDEGRYRVILAIHWESRCVVKYLPIVIPRNSGGHNKDQWVKGTKGKFFQIPSNEVAEQSKTWAANRKLHRAWTRGGGGLDHTCCGDAELEKESGFEKWQEVQLKCVCVCVCV